MRATVLYIAMSLDGYIADENQGVAWLVGDDSDPQHKGSYERFYETIDTILIGYTTYHQVRYELFDGWPYVGKHSYVLTHRDVANTSDITFVDQSLEAVLKKIKQQDGGDIWLCGGASLVTQAIQADLIDRYHITIIPTILGKGIRLFERDLPTVDLRLVSSECYNGMVDVVYERRLLKK